MARAGLDKQVVVAAACLIADSEGLEAVSLARLAKALNVKAPSLYNHVAGLADIRRELALSGLRIAQAVMSKAAVGKSGEEALVAIGLAYRNFGVMHPGLHAASIIAPTHDDKQHQMAGQAILDIVMAVLAGFGLKGDDGLHAIRGLRAIIHGFVSLEIAGGFGLPLDIEESLKRLLTAFARGLRQTAAN